MAKFKKGDRVQVRYKGELLHGTLVRGGQKPCMVIDGTDRTLTGPCQLFSPSQAALPTDPASPMDHWEVRKFREFKYGHGDSATFHAEIWFRGVRVGSVENCGRGGPDLFHIDPQLVRPGQFRENVLSWVAQFGYPDMLEPCDFWVNWYVHERPFGKLASKAIPECRDYIHDLCAKNGLEA